VELCYKDDDLDDPMLNWYHFRELGVADEDLAFCEELGLRVNEILVPFFDEKGVTLVDFKIEVGRDENGNLMLADEISQTPAASGTRRPARSWTRTASGATWAASRSLRRDAPARHRDQRTGRRRLKSASSSAPRAASSTRKEKRYDARSRRWASGA
jgi:phosphoribosylaminoimidazole-succinocarboxamide synthase